ncbi:MAG TPA: HEAT repeat domain-containing protein [Terriglobia bacterium]|nr:HEAT repeat domain-containing protein [Terriglobia bacterium]
MAIGPSKQSPISTPQAMAHKRSRPNLAIIIVPVVLMAITFLFWYQTWFGGRLSNQEMAEYLADTSVPHKTQHALAQMADRITRGDESAKQWYPQLLALARSPQPQFRLTAAWVMGQDNRSAGFCAALRELLKDPEPAVRLNAALALVRFADATGEPELRQALQPYTLRATQAGTVKFLMKKGDAVSPSSVVARIKSASGVSEDVSAPFVGEIKDLMLPDGASVNRGAALVVLSPGMQQAWESLRGLYFVGKAEDVGEIEAFVRNTPQLPDRVKQQAQITAQAMRTRRPLQPPALAADAPGPATR